MIDRCGPSSALAFKLTAHLDVTDEMPLERRNELELVAGLIVVVVVVIAAVLVVALRHLAEPLRSAAALAATLALAVAIAAVADLTSQQAGVGGAVIGALCEGAARGVGRASFARGRAVQRTGGVRRAREPGDHLDPPQLCRASLHTPLALLALVIVT